MRMSTPCILLRRAWAAAVAGVGLVALSSPAPAQTQGAKPAQELVMSLDDYAAAAVREGVRGRQTAISLESASESRRIAFRQTSSPSLNAGFTTTLNENRTIVAGTPDSIARTRALAGSLTFTEPLPTGTVFTASGRRTNTLTGSAFGSATQDQPRYDVSVVQPVYLLVQNSVWRGRYRAGLEFENARESYDQEILAIKSQARSLYYDVLLRTQSLEVEKRKVAGSKALLEVTRALASAGKVAPVESTRAEIRLQRDERQLQNSQVSLDKAGWNALQFISLPLETPVRFTSSLSFEPRPLQLERLEAYALQSRPELRRLRRSLELARISLKETGEATRPTFSLTGSLGLSRDPASRTRAWSAGGTATWLLFDSFVTRSRVRQAQLSETSAKLSLDEAERSTRLEVRSAYLDVTNAEQQIRDFKLSRDQALRNVEVVRTRFQNGIDRLLDVFDAENEARNLDLEYLNLLVNHRLALDRLAQVLGAPLESLPIR